MYFHDQAIVLNRRDFRDNDLLVIFFTLGQGKTVVLAKSAKKIRSKLRGHLEPLNLVEINWVAGRGAEKLTGASSLKSYREIKNNYKKNLLGFYFLEVLDKTTHPHHPDSKLFNFLKNVLEKLEVAEEKDLPLIKLCFDYKLLFLLGYNPINRKDLGEECREAAKWLVNSEVAKVIKMKLDKNVLDKLTAKAKDYLEQVAEVEIKSNEVIKSLKLGLTHLSSRTPVFTGAGLMRDPESTLKPRFLDSRLRGNDKEGGFLWQTRKS